MTDKVQKIREEVVEMVNSINPFIPDEDGKNSDYEAGKLDAATQILQIIDSFEEEPVSDIDFEQELYKAFGQVKDFTLGLQIAKRFYDMGKNHQEPVSEELKEEITRYFSKNPIKHLTDWPALKNTALHFANWQKEQFEKNRLKHCDSITNEQAELEQGFIDQHLDKHNRIPTFLDAIEYGMRLQKKQMMKDAVDAQYRNIFGEVLLAYNPRELGIRVKDKIKILVIKEE